MNGIMKKKKTLKFCQQNEFIHASWWQLVEIKWTQIFFCLIHWNASALWIGKKIIKLSMDINIQMITCNWKVKQLKLESWLREVNRINESKRNGKKTSNRELFVEIHRKTKANKFKITKQKKNDFHRFSLFFHLFSFGFLLNRL